MDLATQTCVPCEGKTPTLSEEETQRYIVRIPNWKIDNGKVERTYTFKDFKEAIRFVNNIAEIAEEQGHHPDISILYNRVNVSFFTHAIHGLSQNDFIMAAKVDALIP